jgi:hypothetical protein
VLVHLIIYAWLLKFYTNLWIFILTIAVKGCRNHVLNPLGCTQVKGMGLVPME